MAYTQVQYHPGGEGDNFGRAIAIDGYYAVLGEGNERGFLFQRQIDGTWTYSFVEITDTSTNFGTSVDIKGNYFVFGQPDHWARGRIAVYNVSNPSSPLATFLGADGDDFGTSVAISDEYIVVGAPSANSNKGRVYVYAKGTGETWTAYAGNPIVPQIQSSNDYFGCSVAISGNTIAVGARGRNSSKGAVYIFTKDTDTGEWEETTTLLASDGSAGDQFGGDVSMSGGYLAVGAKFWDSDEGDVSAGAVYLFKYVTSWYEIDKLTGTGETSYEGNHFGASVDLVGDYLVVGSLDARGTGVADVYYKKRSWGHLKKLIGNEVSSGDNFGSAVGVWGSYIVVAAEEDNNGAEHDGALYFFEDPPVHFRLAQEFEVAQSFLPSKATLYLKRGGENTYGYWPISATQENVIDATNFSSIVQGQDKLIYADSIEGYTGAGYMFLERDDYGDYGEIRYPIRAVASDTYELWIRCISTESDDFNAEVLIDGEVVKTLSETVNNPSNLEWAWVNTTIVLPDTSEHTLGIKIKEKGAAIDKLYIDAASTTPYADGPAYGTSPYVTVHLRCFDSDGSPTTPLFVYDYKNTITDIVEDDWYNFDITVLDEFHGHTTANDFAGSYFLVLSTSGSHAENYIVWDMVDNDEYMMFPSAFRI